MKNTSGKKFDKWYKKVYGISANSPALLADRLEEKKRPWNAACKSILKSIQYKNRMFEGSWQHEDIEFLMEDIKEMICK